MENDYTDCTKPTLAELIEAIGANFKSLIHANYDLVPRWQANAYTGHGKDNWAYGSTPEEAVANLWLALNKK